MTKTTGAVRGGVSIVIPAYNAESTIAVCLEGATNLKSSGDVEIIVVNDGSKDGTARIASSFPGVKVVTVPNGGAPRATNIGVKLCSHDIVVSLDADAVLHEDWLERISQSLEESTVGAAAGYAVTGNKTVVGKLMGYDVELRLDRMTGYTDHLYTMNTAYRRQALLEIGLFDEGMKIGYDVDISRRFKAAGYGLVLNKQARCTHYWRDDLKGYLKQQYNYAYYRLGIARKFGRAHDRLANLGTVLNVPLTALVIALSVLGSVLSPYALLGLLLLPALHLPETLRMLVRRREVCVLALPFLFTLRNIVWVWAAVVWGFRQTAAVRKRGQ